MDVSEQQDPELLLNVFTPELHLDVYALERSVPFLSPVSIILSISNHCFILIELSINRYRTMEKEL
jgi:hypothetical protein